MSTSKWRAYSGKYDSEHPNTNTSTWGDDIMPGPGTQVSHKQFFNPWSLEKLGVVYDDGSLQSEHREGTSPYRDYHVDLTEGENLHVIVDNYWPMSATLELIAPNDNGDLSDPDNL